MVPFLVIVALAAGGLGLVMASEATLGVALIGIGCLVAILARMAQASDHHARAFPDLELQDKLAGAEAARKAESDRVVAAYTGDGGPT